MNKEEFRQLILDEHLISSEYEKDNDYIDEMLVHIYDMPAIFDWNKRQIEIYTDIQNGDSGDYWHEVRIGDFTADTDVPYEQTVSEWYEYFSNLKKQREVHITVPISEYDLEELKEGNSFQWSFDSNDGGTLVHINLIRE